LHLDEARKHARRVLNRSHTASAFWRARQNAAKNLLAARQQGHSAASISRASTGAKRLAKRASRSGGGCRRRRKARLQPVAERHQRIDLGDDAELFGEGGGNSNFNHSVSPRSKIRRSLRIAPIAQGNVLFNANSTNVEKPLSDPQNREMLPIPELKFQSRDFGDAGRPAFRVNDVILLGRCVCRNSSWSARENVFDCCKIKSIRRMFRVRKNERLVPRDILEAKCDSDIENKRSRASVMPQPKAA